MLIALASLKSSPGVTTAALALAAMWQGSEKVVVVEADPAGGDLAARFGLQPSPGLVSLSAAARRDHGVKVAFDHAQELPGGLSVIAAPAASEQSAAAAELLTGDGMPLWANLAADEEVVVVLDCGRLDSASNSRGLLAAADIALLVARPRLDECDRLAKALDALAIRAEATGTELGLVLSGPGFERGQVEASMRMRVWAHLPHDPKAAAVLAGEPGKTRRLASLALPKTARTLAGELATHLAVARLESLPQQEAVAGAERRVPQASSRSAA